jgi:hypothetical protein
MRVLPKVFTKYSDFLEASHAECEDEAEFVGIYFNDCMFVEKPTFSNLVHEMIHHIIRQPEDKYYSLLVWFRWMLHATWDLVWVLPKFYRIEEKEIYGYFRCSITCFLCRLRNKRKCPKESNG